MLLTGKITRVKKGKMTMIKITVPRKLKRVDKKYWKIMGSIMSQMSTSLAKRLITLPRGVVSKKDMGALISDTYVVQQTLLLQLVR